MNKVIPNPLFTLSGDVPLLCSWEQGILFLSDFMLAAALFPQTPSTENPTNRTLSPISRGFLRCVRFQAYSYLTIPIKALPVGDVSENSQGLSNWRRRLKLLFQRKEPGTISTRPCLSEKKRGLKTAPSSPKGNQVMVGSLLGSPLGGYGVVTERVGWARGTKSTPPYNHRAKKILKNRIGRMRRRISSFKESFSFNVSFLNTRGKQLPSSEILSVLGLRELFGALLPSNPPVRWWERLYT